ncbi:Hypothetical predicted protein [Mytilus galloprovincialis]|uniref:DZIP3-like HEPN domain-containing protein n=1 Tax=Mytilus galloprovincialis TaxID=29158 RepID=A0A8B6GM75_MYTGA|nr:Hypothetical predicted protein [Mytilus galloprovincialis]
MVTPLPQEDINFLRLTGLLIRIAPRAVRRLFDKEFHPDQLTQFLRKNRPKIDDLTFRKRVITQAEYELLYPKGSTRVSSDMFDISLMTCLLRNFTDIDIQDSLPLETIHTTAADISRIKFYRNYIVHSESGEVTENKFTVIWKCLEEAILRLLPELKPEIEAMMSSSSTNIGDIKHVLRLEKELEKTNQKLETLEIQQKNVREIRHRILKEWRETDKKYVSISANTFCFKSLQDNKGVIITGSPGCGKSAAAHHVALELEKEGYEIFPCDDPSEILIHFTSGKFQVFVLDDVCGKFTLNQQKADYWDEYDGKLNMLLELNQNDDKEDSSSKSEEDEMSKSMEDSYNKFDVNVSRKSQVKFIITCRENIYSHKAFPKLACFSLVQCSFSTYYKMSLDEMQKIALAYVSEDTVNDIQNMCLFDFFPLICALYGKKVNRDPRFFTHPVEIIEKEISVMKIKSESSFLCLSLLVLKNNNISKDDLRSGDVGHLVKSVCSDCDIELVVSMVTLQNYFERLKGIYIIEEGEIYKAIHDKMFDIIAAAIASSIMKSLITYAEIAFLANRIQLLSLGRSYLSFAVHIPQGFERVYLKRIHKEAMSGKYWEVFGGIQVENEAYRKLLLSYLKEQDTCQQTSYETSEDGSTPLFVSSSLGYVDFVKYFIAKCPNHINVKDTEGRSSFYVACKNGHIAVVKYLIHYYEDVNAEMAYKTTALSAACYNGHTEVAKLLLENNADINRTNNLKHNALYCACYSGNVQLVSLLLRTYNLDKTIRDNDDRITLHTSCVRGNTQRLKQAKKFVRDVNQQSDDGQTPLFSACFEGHYETVKLLLDLNGQTLEKCVDTTIKVNEGFSSLHIACNNGHTEVVKLLIGVGMNVNDTGDNGQTSLFAACLSGHYETVKYLLALNGQQLNSRVDTTIKDINGWSALHAACSKGHTEVVKLLIDVDLNVNDKTNRLLTPLLLACYHGHFETVKYLLYSNGNTLDNRVDIRIKHQKGCGHYDTVKLLTALNGKLLESRENATIKYKYGWSALQGACSKGHTEIVKLLVDFGMNLNFTLGARGTPLYLACENGHYNTVKFLLDLNRQTLNSRVDTIIKNRNGQSVLHVACLNGHTEVVKLLVGVGLNVNDTTHNGCTPLYLACQNGHTDMVKYLLDLNGGILNSRVDTKFKDEDGMSVLHKACSKGHKEVVKLLIDVGMNVNDISNKGYTPIYLSCQNGHYDIVKHLLDLNGDTLNSCVDTTIKSASGWSVLHEACFEGHTNIVRLLITANVKLNDKAKFGSTPLHLACEKGHYETVKCLLDLNGDKTKSRVDTTVKDTHGNSASRVAFLNQHTEIKKLLTDHGINEAEQRRHSMKEYCVIS